MVQLTNLPLSAFAYLRAEVGLQPYDSRTLTSGLEIELFRVFIPILVTCMFHKDPIQNEDAIMSTTYFPALKGM